MGYEMDQASFEGGYKQDGRREEGGGKGPGKGPGTRDLARTRPACHLDR